MSDTIQVHLESEENGPLARTRWAGVMVRAATIVEGVCRLFRIDLELSFAADAKERDWLVPGKRVSLLVEVDGARRVFHGMLGAISMGLVQRSKGGSAAEDPGAGGAPSWWCKATLVSRFESVGMVRCNDVYVDATLMEVCRSKLVDRYQFVEASDVTHGDFQFALSAREWRRSLHVQYEEQDNAFLGRISGDKGIAFFFEHGERNERLVVTDLPERMRRSEDAPTITYRISGEARDVFAFEEHRRTVPRAHSVRNGDEGPSDALIAGMAELDGDGALGGVDEYGAAVYTRDEAEALARIRAEMHACERLTFRGSSTVLPLASATRTRLVEHPAWPNGRELLVLEVTHRIRVRLPGDPKAVASYANDFLAIPGEQPYRPPLWAPRPRISGVVSATIVGLSGVAEDDGQVDEAGAYRIQLNFDAHTYAPGERAPVARLAQPLVGVREGLHFPLRAGTEVLVAFLNGDPDRPVIVGAVQNQLSPSVLTSTERGLNRIHSAAGVRIDFGRAPGTSGA